MRIVTCCLFVALSGLNVTLAQRVYLGPRVTRFEESAARVSFESLDFSVLKGRLQRARPGLTENERESLLQHNLTHIFLNNLNRQRMLVAPSPEDLVDRIASIMKLNEDLAALISDAQRRVRDHSTSEKRELAGHISSKANQLGKQFGDYFLDLKNGSETVVVRRFAEPDAEFIHYLLLSQGIQNQLAGKLEDYFFGSSPAAIALSDYYSPSITVLAESLVAVSELARKKLRIH